MSKNHYIIIESEFVSPVEIEVSIGDLPPPLWNFAKGIGFNSLTLSSYQLGADVLSIYTRILTHLLRENSDKFVQYSCISGRSFFSVIKIEMHGGYISASSPDNTGIVAEITALMDREWENYYYHYALEDGLFATKMNQSKRSADDDIGRYKRLRVY